MKFLSLTALFALTAGAALAENHAEVEGDAANGEKLFGRQCVACHVVVDEDGEKIAGRNARTGPNLYGAIGRAPGTLEGFRYSKAMEAYGEMEGVTWGADNFVPYVQDPVGHLREVLDDPKARGSMAFRVRSEDEAKDLYAFLAQYGSEMEGEDDS